MKLKNGMTIEYVDGFGSGMTRQAKIERIELVPNGEKYGSQINEADLEIVMNSENYVLDLDNGKWAYGSQVKAVLS